MLSGTGAVTVLTGWIAVTENRPVMAAPDQQPPSERGALDELDDVGTPGMVPSGRWMVDPTRSSVTFVARHLLVSRVTGRFTRITGLVDVGADPLDSTVHAMADAASLTTGDAARDEHLRSPAFFDVGRWPTLELTGRALRAPARPNGPYALDVDLTIRDVTRLVTLDVTATLLDTDDNTNGSAPTPGRRAVRFTVDGTLNRKDFGLQWNAAIEAGGVVVGDIVTVAISAVAELDR